MTIAPLLSPDEQLRRGLELLDVVHDIITMFLIEEGGEITFYSDGEVDWAQAHKLSRYQRLREMFADKIIADRKKQDERLHSDSGSGKSEPD